VAEKRDYTPYQQRVIQRYYRNQESLRTQSLAELVSDLYLATTDKKKESLWKRAEALLLALGQKPETVAHVVGNRRLDALAALASKAQDRPPGAAAPKRAP
jgi:hypothetical protein